MKFYASSRGTYYVEGVMSSPHIPHGCRSSCIMLVRVLLTGHVEFRMNIVRRYAMY